MRALELIRVERVRQKAIEGWTAEHDDEHTDESLANAAACYAMAGNIRHPTVPPREWPWSRLWWRPTPGDRVRELVKAGALIVAEIERLERRRERQP